MTLPAQRPSSGTRPSSSSPLKQVPKKIFAFRDSSVPCARRTYPRAKATDSSRYTSPRSENLDFTAFRSLTMPSREEAKEHIFDKPAADPFRHDMHYIGAHISVAPPEAKLQLVLRDRRNRALPTYLRSQGLDILDKPLRCLDSRAPPSHPSDQFCDVLAARLPPQPIPAVTQHHEADLVETLEKALQQGDTDQTLWAQYAKRTMELVLTMQLDRVLRVLKAFVLAGYRGADLYVRIGTELAKEVKNGSSTRLCQALHWLARAGLRDPTLMTLVGNECVLRVADDFLVDMLIETLNVHAKLEVRNPRLLNAVIRELVPLIAEFGKDQCCAVAPLTVMNVMQDVVRIPYLARCAELGMGLPVHMTKPAVLRQFRLLEDCLRLDYRPTSLPNVVQLWLVNLKSEADVHDVIQPVLLSPVEEDMLRILREDMDVEVLPTVQDGVFTAHLVMGKTIIEVLDSYADYYVTPAMQGQRLLRADTKLRQRMLWRHGWRILTVEKDDWMKLRDDLFKKDLLEDLLQNGPRRRPAE